MGLRMTQVNSICAATSLRPPSSAATRCVVLLCTNLLKLQLDDLLLEGISFVLSLHVSLFCAVLLGTETPKQVISQLQRRPSSLPPTMKSQLVLQCVH